MTSLHSPCADSIYSTHVAISCFVCRWSWHLPGRVLYWLWLCLFHPRGNQLFCLQVVLAPTWQSSVLSLIIIIPPTWQSAVCLQMILAISGRDLYCIYSTHVAISCLYAGGPCTYLSQFSILFDCIYPTHVAISCFVCRWSRHLPGRVDGHAHHPSDASWPHAQHNGTAGQPL